MAQLFPAPEAAALTGATLNQIERLVQIQAIYPAAPAPRRGMNRLYDQRNLAEIMIASELINSGVTSDDVKQALLELHKPEQWAKLIPAAHSDAIMILRRLAGSTAAPDIKIESASETRWQVNRGYTTLGEVGLAYVLRTIEKFTGEPFA